MPTSGEEAQLPPWNLYRGHCDEQPTKRILANRVADRRGHHLDYFSHSDTQYDPREGCRKPVFRGGVVADDQQRFSFVLQQLPRWLPTEPRSSRASGRGYWLQCGWFDRWGSGYGPEVRLRLHMACRLHASCPRQRTGRLRGRVHRHVLGDCRSIWFPHGNNALLCGRDGCNPAES